jgi:hypothetical protein
MLPNFASIMPQAVAVWAEELGCQVHYVTFTGSEDLERELAAEIDILFISSFTSAAYLAYSISHFFRRRGIVTVLGGPHARAYADDSRNYFDYVLGTTDKTLVEDLLRGFARQPGRGLSLGSERQAPTLPGLRERWKYVRANLDKAVVYGVVPMLGSIGCPYRCGFCVDSQVPHQTLSYEQIREDLRFLKQQLERPVAGWHDPNFGVRFDDTLGMIEEAVRLGSVRFVGESSLSLLGESRLQRLKRNGFVGMIVGIENWFGYGDKAGRRGKTGTAKAEEVAEHVDWISHHIPYTQANFVLGLDEDAGPEPFELTKRFVDLAPAAYPAFSLFTAFGDSAPLNAELEAEGRVLDAPFPFLDCASIHNVRLKNYDGVEFYGHLVDLMRHAYSPRRTWRRVESSRHPVRCLERWMSPIRSIASRARVLHYERIRTLLRRDSGFRAFCEGESEILPPFFGERIRGDLGEFYAYLPPGIVGSLNGSQAAGHRSEN